MTISAPSVMKNLFNQTVALGEKSVNSDAWFEVKGFEGMSLLCKQFPWPELSSAGEIEVPLPVGGAMWQAQQVKFNQQGAVTFLETVDGVVGRFLEQVIAQGGYFDATVYEGTPEQFTQKKDITRCFFQVDPADRDWENRSQVTQISGTLFYHYFGTE